MKQAYLKAELELLILKQKQQKKETLKELKHQYEREISTFNERYKDTDDVEINDSEHKKILFDIERKKTEYTRKSENEIRRLQNLIHQYDNHSEEYTHVLNKLAYDAKDPDFYAIMITGPQFLRYELCNHKTLTDILPLRIRNSYYISPLENSKSWAISYNNIKQVEDIERIKSAIQFELKQFGILRLDDHLANIHTSALAWNTQQNMREELVKYVQELFSVEQSPSIAQCTFQDDITSKLYQNTPALEMASVLKIEEKVKLQKVCDAIFGKESFDKNKFSIKMQIKNFAESEEKYLGKCYENLIKFWLGLNSKQKQLLRHHIKDNYEREFTKFCNYFRSKIDIEDDKLEQFKREAINSNSIQSNKKTEKSNSNLTSEADDSSPSTPDLNFEEGFNAKKLGFI